ncbi:MAG: transposase [Bacteriovorax sp.]|nr:transposase [Bacteriovorax sp.]
MKHHHSAEFKESIVQKITTPGGPSIMQMSVKTGVHHASIRNWVKSYANTSGMKKSNEWTPKKLQAIAHTITMNEKQLGEFLRSNGLHSSDLEQWKQDFYSSQQSPGRPRLDPELVTLRAEKKELSSDLKRKDKALAEMAARIILIKKSQLLFGVNEEDE